MPRREWKNRAEHAQLFRLPAGSAAGEEALDALDDHDGGNGLRQHFIEADAAEASDFVLADHAAERDEDRVTRGRLLLEDFRSLEAADRRHGEVEEDDVGLPVTYAFEALVRRAGGADVVASVRQEALIRGSHGVVIVDDEDAALWFGGHCAQVREGTSTNDDAIAGAATAREC
jgi:hypothetical protein